MSRELQAAKFVHTVSKGSRYNQIYVPRDKEGVFEAGDIVEVRLLEKRVRLYYSPGLPKLMPFKAGLVRDVFSFLAGAEGIRQIFIVGSFLTQKVDYNDIDIVLITSKGSGISEEGIYDKLTDRFNLRFHVIGIEEGRFPYLAEACPLTRAMLHCHVSNKKFSLPERKVDKRHIQFLLMMPEDVLEIDVPGRVLYDSIRRLVAIERFLGNMDEDPRKTSHEAEKIMGPLLLPAKNNENISQKDVSRLREIIKEKLSSINGVI